VYRRNHISNDPVVALALRPHKGDIEVVYCLRSSLKAVTLPEPTTKRGIKDNQGAIDLPLLKYEEWWIIKPNLITEGGLYVGAHDYHSREAVLALKKSGSPANKKSKVLSFVEKC
jgi:hypothetical protein